MRQDEKWEKKKKLLQLSKRNPSTRLISAFYPPFLSWELQFFLISREVMQLARSARFTFFIQAAGKIYAGLSRWRRKAVQNILRTHNLVQKINFGVTRSTINFYRFFIWQGYKPRLNIEKSYQNRLSLLQRLFLDRAIVDLMWTRGIYKFFYQPTKAQKTSRINTYFHEYWGKHFGSVPRVSRAKLYFSNYHKPLIWKMRSARIAYWDMYKTGRLNRRRFRNLAAILVRQGANNQFNYRNLFVWLAQLQLVSSWRHLDFLLRYKLITINGSYNYCTYFYSVGTIIESLAGPFLFWASGLLKRFFWRLTRRVKMWAYRRYLHTQCYYLTKPKNTPKFLTQIVVQSTQLYSVFECDLNVGAVALIQPFLKQQQLVPDLLINNTTLKLTTWRFRFM